MMNSELARSMCEERQHEVEAEYARRSQLAQLEAQATQRRGSRPSFLRRLSSILLVSSLPRLR